MRVAFITTIVVRPSPAVKRCGRSWCWSGGRARPETASVVNRRMEFCSVDENGPCHRRVSQRLRAAAAPPGRGGHCARRILLCTFVFCLKTKSPMPHSPPPFALQCAIPSIHSIGRRVAAALLPRLFRTNPRSHHKGATGRVRTGNQRLPVLCHCQLGQDIPITRPRRNLLGLVPFTLAQPSQGP